MKTPTDNPYIDASAAAAATVFTVPALVDGADPQLYQLAEVMEEHLGRLRFHIFVRTLESNWFEDVDTITVAWEWEQENRVPTPQAFGDRSQANSDFETLISQHFNTEDATFANLINLHFGNDVEVSKSDLANMARAVVPRRFWHNWMPCN